MKYRCNKGSFIKPFDVSIRCRTTYYFFQITHTKHQKACNELLKYGMELLQCKRCQREDSPLMPQRNKFHSLPLMTSGSRAQGVKCLNTLVNTRNRKWDGGWVNDTSGTRKSASGMSIILPGDVCFSIQNR